MSTTQENTKKAAAEVDCSSLTSFLSSFDRESGVVEESHFSLIEEGLNVSDENGLVEVLTFLGDINRQEANRNAIGEQRNILEKLVSHLSSSSPLIIQYTGRAIGNIGYQQEGNRNTFVELSVPSKLFSILQAATDTNVQKNCTGALANVSFVSDGVQKELVEAGVIDLLMKQLTSPVEHVVVMTIRAIANIMDDSTREEFQKSSCLDQMVNLLFENQSALIRSDALTTLGTITEGAEDEILRIAKFEDWLQRIHSIAKHDEDEQVRTDAWIFLSSLAENVEVKPVFNEKGILVALMKDVDVKADAIPLASTLQVLGYLAADDSCMDEIFASFSVFFDLMEHEDSNVKTYTAMIVGNISRKDDYCIRLVQAGAVPLLKELCKQEARIQHLALGAVRNISIPDENKEAIANEEGMIDTLLKCIKDGTNAHVLYNGIIVLKILANGGDSFIAKLIDSGCLDVMDALYERTLEEGQERIHFEASRFLAILGSSNENNLKKVSEHSVMKAISLLFSTTFELLHKEALSLLIPLSQQECYHQQIAESSVVTEAIAILSFSPANATDILSCLLKLHANEKVKEIIREETNQEKLQKAAETFPQAKELLKVQECE